MKTPKRKGSKAKAAVTRGRGKKHTLKRPAIKTVHHPVDSPAKTGSDERTSLLRYSALQLRIRGMQHRHIGEAIAKEFDLVKVPDEGTVRYWIREALAEAMKENKKQAEEYVAIFKERSEEIILTLMPYAIDEFKVQRTKMVDGEPTVVIDEEVMDERLKACAEIRKQGESVLKALGVTRPQVGEGEKMSGEGVKSFIIQTVTNHIASESKTVHAIQDKATIILELESGDEAVDSL